MNHLFTAASVAALAGALMLVSPFEASAQKKPTQVEVVNPVTDPVQTRDVDHPARQPFQALAVVNLADGEFSDVASFNPALPPGKMFVIEFVSANVSMPTGQRGKFILFVGNSLVGLQYHFGLSLVGTDNGTVDHLETQHATRLYQSDPGFGHRVNFTRFDNQGAVSFFVNLSGHLVDQ